MSFWDVKTPVLIGLVHNRALMFSPLNGRGAQSSGLGIVITEYPQTIL